MVTHTHCSLFLEFTKRANELSSFSHPPLSGETGSNLPKHSGDSAASSPSSWMDSVSSLSPLKSFPRFRSPPLSKLHFHVIWILSKCAFQLRIVASFTLRAPEELIRKMIFLLLLLQVNASSGDETLYIISMNCDLNL